MNGLLERRPTSDAALCMIEDRLRRLHLKLRLAAQATYVPPSVMDEHADSVAEVLMILRGDV